MEDSLKRPSFQFYPGDWLRDTSLRACSEGARGLWVDMLCLMHEGKPYGYLKSGDNPISDEQLSRMTGIPIKTLKGYLKELGAMQVFSVDSDGAYFSRRMVRDEEIREARAKGGAASQNNPNVPRKKNIEKDTHKDILPTVLKDTHKDIQTSTLQGIPFRAADEEAVSKEESYLTPSTNTQVSTGYIGDPDFVEVGNG